jgi:heme a synthase
MKRSVPAPPHDSHRDSAADWRSQIPEPRRRRLRIWLWSGAALTFLILVIGGITRLTLSGLSIVEWHPVIGVIPPLNEAQWQEAFDAYRQFPEYQKLRQGMTLSEFQFIFFWEYIHRVFARLIGLVFAIPFVWFWLRGYLNRPLLKRALVLFALGASQGLMGWLMVRSGLVDRPSVSHYRLAAHLSLAFAIFGCCVWFATDLRPRATPLALGRGVRRWLSRGLLAVGALFGLQVLWGALVAGLRAGKFFNTFPLMNGGLLPPNGMDLSPALLNLVENPITVQWIHRVLGTVLLVAVVVFFQQVRKRTADPGIRTLNVAFLALMLAQYGLGVLTLLYRVPVSLGVIHQAMAMVIFGVWLVWLHRVRNAAGEAAGGRSVHLPVGASAVR